MQRMRTGDCCTEQSRPRHRKVWNPVRRISSSCRHAPRNRSCQPQYGTGTPKDVSSNGGSQGSRRRRRMRHQWRYLRCKLRVSGRHRQGAARGCLHSGLSAASIDHARWLAAAAQPAGKETEIRFACEQAGVKESTEPVRPKGCPGVSCAALALPALAAIGNQTSYFALGPCEPRGKVSPARALPA